MHVSGKLVPRTLTLLVTAALGFGAVQASASPAAPRAAANLDRCSDEDAVACYEECVLIHGPNTQSSCVNFGIPTCTCLR